MKSTIVNITNCFKQLLSRRVIICCLILCGWFFSSITFNAESSQNERADDKTKKANFFSIRDEFYKQWPAMKARQIQAQARQVKTNTGRPKAKGRANKKQAATQSIVDDDSHTKFRRWEWYWSTRVSESGEFPSADSIQKEWQKYQQKKQNSPLMRNMPQQSRRGRKARQGPARGAFLWANWDALGPFGSPEDNDGYLSEGGLGRVTSVAFGASESTIYIGTPNSGLWKSTNSGEDWGHMTASLLPHGVSSIATDPPNKRVYMGCMAMNMSDWTDSGAASRISLGVYLSTDNGVSWNPSNGGAANTLGGRSIRRLRIDPTDTKIIFAATDQGLARSTDAGATWQFVASGFDCGDVEINPANHNFIYASSFAGNMGSIIRSTTGGGAGTFSPFTDGISFPMTSFSRIELAISAANPNWLYAMCSDINRNAFLALYRMPAALSTANPLPFASQWDLRCDSSDEDLTGEQAGSNFTIAVSPGNATRVYVGGLNFMVSGDGGESWTRETDSNPITADYMHADQWEIAFPPGSNGKKVYVGNDGGIYRSNDWGDTFTEINGDLSIMTIYRIGVDQNHSTRTFVGAQDNGVNRYLPSPKGGNTPKWIKQHGNDGMTCLVNPLDSHYVFVMSQNGRLFTADDGGVSFSEETPSAELDEDDKGKGLWITPIVFNKPLNRVYFGYGRVYGGAGNSASEPVPVSGKIPSGLINAMAVSADGQTLFASTIDSDGNASIYRAPISVPSGNIGGWTQITGSGSFKLSKTPITDIACHPTDPKILYISLGRNGGVFKSVNSGKTWTNISGALPQVSVNSIVTENDPSRPGREALYIGTDFGVLYRDNALTDWDVYDIGGIWGLPNTSVMDLEIHNSMKELRAGTYGRGLYKTALYTPPITTRYYPTFFGRDSLNYWIKSIKFTTSNGEISSNSGNNNGYADFTASIDPLQFYKGGEYKVRLTRDRSVSATVDPWPWWSIWVDLNTDGDFSDAGELVVNGAPKPNSGETAEVTLKLPSNYLAIGKTRMRVAMVQPPQLFAQLNGSGAFEVGEVEDYTIQMNDCVSVGQMTAYPVADTSARISWTMSPGDNSVFNIRYKLASSSAWTYPSNPPINKDVSNPLHVLYRYDLKGLQTNQTYHYQMQRICSSDPKAASKTAWSSTLFIHTISSSAPYCASFGMPTQGTTNMSVWISQVRLGKGRTTYLDQSSPDKIVGYSRYNYPDLTARELPQALPIILNLTAQRLLPPDYSSPKLRWRIWIDLNQDNDFNDADEMVYDSKDFIPSLTQNGSFTIPTTSKFGITRMRVSVKAPTNANDYDPPEPCSSFNSGEVEDFKVKIYFPQIVIKPKKK